MVGFTVDQEYEREGKLRAVALIAGNVRILIVQDDGAKGWDRVKGEGFSLHFTTVQDVDEIAKRIKEFGGTLESEPADMPWGARAFRLQDPDGFNLTISSRVKLHVRRRRLATDRNQPQRPLSGPRRVAAPLSAPHLPRSNSRAQLPFLLTMRDYERPV